MKSTARTESFFDKTDGHMFMAKASPQHQLRIYLERNEFYQVCLHTKEYLFDLHPRYVDETDQMLRNLMTIPSHRTYDDYIFDK